ncbi:hypothetical protein [Dactylosporangium sp. CA-233914]|uniref:hypothetical protein n=1 Tax=Dactylosporangium sp. CA-233914 TaxID=3239934 RepID=UPI003D8FE3B4
MGGDLGGAGLGVQTGQALGMTRLQTSAAGLSELGTDRTATSHTTAVLGQHRVQSAAPFRFGGCRQHLGHEKNLEQGYDKNP